MNLRTSCKSGEEAIRCMPWLDYCRTRVQCDCVSFKSLGGAHKHTSCGSLLVELISTPRVEVFLCFNCLVQKEPGSEPHGKQQTLIARVYLESCLKEQKGKKNKKARDTRGSRKQRDTSTT